MYKSPAALMVGCTEETPIFGQLSRIIVYNRSEVLLELCSLRSHWDHHLHAYIVVREDNIFAVSIEELMDYRPYGIYLPVSFKSNEPERCIVLRSTVSKCIQ